MKRKGKKIKNEKYRKSIRKKKKEEKKKAQIQNHITNLNHITTRPMVLE